jgi:hypothetical protein
VKPNYNRYVNFLFISDVWTRTNAYISFLNVYSAAIDEPVIAEPESFGGIPIDESFYCLVLMSDGLYKSLEDSKVLNQDVNVEILGLVTAELQAQSTINGVCQAVVDRICRYHHDGFMNQNKLCERRDDMTLLVRLFNAQLGGNTPSPVSPLTNFHPFSGKLVILIIAIHMSSICQEAMYLTWMNYLCVLMTVVSHLIYVSFFISGYSASCYCWSSTKLGIVVFS